MHPEKFATWLAGHRDLYNQASLHSLMKIILIFVVKKREA